MSRFPKLNMRGFYSAIQIDKDMEERTTRHLQGLKLRSCLPADAGSLQVNQRQTDSIFKLLNTSDGPLQTAASSSCTGHSCFLLPVTQPEAPLFPSWMNVTSSWLRVEGVKWSNQERQGPQVQSVRHFKYFGHLFIYLFHFCWLILTLNTIFAGF